MHKNRKIPIHTTLEHSTIKKLEFFGDGRLNAGIEKAVYLAESKQLNTKNELIKIAEFILSGNSE